MVALAAALAGCSGDECLADLSADCAPLYEPSFQNVFAQTLKPSCAIGRAACHAPEGAKHGLVLAETHRAGRLGEVVRHRGRHPHKVRLDAPEIAEELAALTAEAPDTAYPLRLIGLHEGKRRGASPSGPGANNVAIRVDAIAERIQTQRRGLLPPPRPGG